MNILFFLRNIFRIQKVFDLSVLGMELEVPIGKYCKPGWTLASRSGGDDVAWACRFSTPR